MASKRSSTLLAVDSVGLAEAADSGEDANSLVVADRTSELIQHAPSILTMSVGTKIQDVLATYG
jgi:hypothetical protein